MRNPVKTLVKTPVKTPVKTAIGRRKQRQKQRQKLRRKLRQDGELCYRQKKRAGRGEGALRCRIRSHSLSPCVGLCVGAVLPYAKRIVRGLELLSGTQ